MSEAGPTTAELQRSPETASMQETTLHLRLVHGGEALNPDATDLTPPTAEQIEQADNTDVNTCIRNASTAECAAHYNDTESQEIERRSRTATGTEQQQIHNEKVQRYERHLQNWLTETTERAQTEYNPDTPEGQRRLGVLQQLGLLNQGEQFTQETAQRLYDRFCFAQDGTNLMDQFIDTIVRTHSLEEIQQNIPDIRWLAHAGGSMNADVVVHTALARKQAQHTEQRQYLTHKAAETTTVNNTAVSNYNIVTPEARRILSHLYKHRPQEAQQPQEQTPPNEPPVDPSGRRQEQDDDTRATPDLAPEINRLPPGFRRENRIRMPDRMYSSIKDIENFILSPEIMAQRLHNEQPDLFAGQTPQETTQQIQNERDTLRQELRDLGFDASNLTEAVETYTNQYREFLHTKYGIDLPSFPVHVYPYEGPTTSHLFEDSKHALGFVKPHQPVIYLNMKKIKNQTPDILGVNTPWDELPNQQKKYVLDRLLSEIIPHELTHLMGTVRHSIVSNDQTNDMMVSARVFGTEVGKEMFPRKPDGSNDFDVLYRGGGLSEAITVELTDQWATNINGELDIPAYTNERKVLHALCDVIAQEQGISRNEAFAYFARAYFDTKDLGTLSRFLVGKTEDKPGIAYQKRPHFLQEVSFLMRYEKQKAGTTGSPDYTLTLNFIHGRLNQQQRQELIQLLGSSTPLFLSPQAQEHLRAIAFGQDGTHVLRDRRAEEEEDQRRRPRAA